MHDALEDVSDRLLRSDATRPDAGGTPATVIMETNLDNLTLLCRNHHHNFATRGWTCQLNPDRLPEWRPPRYIDPHQRPMINTRITGGTAARTFRLRT